MNLIGITGKIGSGKSSVSQYLKEKGFKIIEKVKLEPYEKDHIALLVEKNF